MRRGWEFLLLLVVLTVVIDGFISTVTPFIPWLIAGLIFFFASQFIWRYLRRW